MSREGVNTSHRRVTTLNQRDDPKNEDDKVIYDGGRGGGKIHV